MFRSWINTARVSRVNRVGCNAVLRSMPDAVTLADLEDRRAIHSAMVAGGISPVTAGVYLSRFWSTMRKFSGTYRQRESRPPAPLSPEHQLADALSCLSRWPDVAPYLRDALARAAADILAEKP